MSPMSDFDVVVGAGSLRSADPGWTRRFLLG
jgi:hypothetical protein